MSALLRSRRDAVVSVIRIVGFYLIKKPFEQDNDIVSCGAFQKLPSAITRDTVSTGEPKKAGKVAGLF